MSATTNNECIDIYVFSIENRWSFSLKGAGDKIDENLGILILKLKNKLISTSIGLLTRNKVDWGINNGIWEIFAVIYCMCGYVFEVLAGHVHCKNSFDINSNNLSL